MLKRAHDGDGVPPAKRSPPESQGSVACKEQPFSSTGSATAGSEPPPLHPASKSDSDEDLPPTQPYPATEAPEPLLKRQPAFIGTLPPAFGNEIGAAMTGSALPRRVRSPAPPLSRSGSEEELARTLPYPAMEANDEATRSEKRNTPNGTPSELKRQPAFIGTLPSGFFGAKEGSGSEEVSYEDFPPSWIGNGKTSS